MSEPKSIILDPKLMFQTLEELENNTNSIFLALGGMFLVLDNVSKLTYAIGFGALMKQAEADISQVAHAVVAANNAVNTACSGIVNRLVDKFAPEGARSSYAVNPFPEMKITTNVADRTAIHPKEMEKLFEDLALQLLYYDKVTTRLKTTYEHTKNFWSGSSAEHTRHNFKSKVLPLFDKLYKVVLTIYNKGLDWVSKSIKFEASLNTP